MRQTAQQRAKRMSIRKDARTTKIDLINKQLLDEAVANKQPYYIELHPTKGLRRHTLRSVRIDKPFILGSWLAHNQKVVAALSARKRPS